MQNLELKIVRARNTAFNGRIISVNKSTLCAKIGSINYFIELIHEHKKVNGEFISTPYKIEDLQPIYLTRTDKKNSPRLLVNEYDILK